MRATLSVLQEALVLQDVAGGLVELDVVDDAVGEVLSAHVGVGSASDEKAQRRIVVELVGGREPVGRDEMTVEVQRQTGHRVPRYVDLRAQASSRFSTHIVFIHTFSSFCSK